MPFIGKDWRSPGEQWVKTDEGSWERLKILCFNSCHQSGFHSCGESSGESDSDNESSGSNDEARNNLDQCLNVSSFANTTTADNVGERNSRVIQWQPPYCHITLKSTKEVAGYNTISEAFYKLDFCNAIRDIRRFNYICKLLHLLITQNLTSLSGCATKVLFTLLERVAWQVASNQQNIHVLHTLLYDLKKIMRKYYCWGRPLGSTTLWKQHLRTIEKICQMANTIEIKEPENDGSKKLTDLPEELIREILLRLSDYKDLINSGQAYEVMHSLLDEQHIWRQLCKYHFSKLQVKQATPAYTKADGTVDWEQMFHNLRRKFGLKEEYADCLFLCRHCRCLFWKSFGHPCIINQENNPPNVKSPSPTNDNAHVNRNNIINNQGEPQGEQGGQQKYLDLSVPEHVPVPPQAFLKFFSL
ncbi:F-box only protein 25-like protein [Dinothrombium tinctorium]|uniref:F-box only protein 25-like protein n=1 Tax=Dinothrombium tinctorium TaxID=1965070 RepID=A0A3S3QLX2_9ACAR|nr:F-box only protein 25-like protein [Dinothrombium tinctorium]